MRKTQKTQSERNSERVRMTAAAQALALRITQEEARAEEPPHRFLIAALLSFAVLVLGLASSGCTIGQTRFMLGATLVADAATTQSALSANSNAQEGNPVLQKAPVPIMLVLSGVVALVAEKQVKNGEIAKAKTLYRVASVVHGLAAAWNGYQMGKTGTTASAASATVQPALALKIPPPPGGGGRGPGARLGF